MRKLLATIALVAAVAAVAAVPAFAWDDGLTVDQVVCDTETGQNVVTITYVNNEDDGFWIGPWFINQNNNIDVVKVNGDELDPAVTVADGGGTQQFTVTYAGNDTGDHWITLTIGWNKYADNFFAYDGPDNGHGPDFDTIKVKVNLEECALVPEDPPVRLVAPRINTTGYCVQTLNRGWTYVEAALGAFDAGQEWRALYDSGAAVFVAGHDLKLAAEGQDGIVVAPIVPGIGGTCDQPWVSNATPPVVKTA